MLERANRRPFLTVFFEKFEPQNFVGHRVDPKKALPYVTMRVSVTVRQNPSTGDFSRRLRVRGKIKIKRVALYNISRISPGASLRPIGTNFGLRIRLVDIINCAKLYRNRLRVWIL